MEYHRENLKTGHAEKAQNRQPRSAEGRPKVYAFSCQSDRQTEMARETAKRLGIPFVDPLRAEIEPSAVGLLKPKTFACPPTLCQGVSIYKAFLRKIPRSWGTYDPRVKFRHRFRRFVALLSQRI